MTAPGSEMHQSAADAKFNGTDTICRVMGDLKRLGEESMVLGTERHYWLPCLRGGAVIAASMIRAMAGKLILTLWPAKDIAGNLLPEMSWSSSCKTKVFAISWSISHLTLLFGPIVLMSQDGLQVSDNMTTTCRCFAPHRHGLAQSASCRMCSLLALLRTDGVACCIEAESSSHKTWRLAVLGVYSHLLERQGFAPLQSNTPCV